MTIVASNPCWVMLELSSRIYSIRYITWVNDESCAGFIALSGIGNVVYSNVTVHEMFSLALEKLYMSRITRKQTFCICENKNPNQPRS